MNEFKLRYSITEKDFMEAYEAHWTESRLSTRSNLSIGFIGILGGIAISYLIGWYGIILFVIGLALILMCASRYLLHVRAFRENEKYKSEIEVTFKDDEIDVLTRDGESKLKWTVYIKYLDTEKFLLLYLSPRSFSIIPKNSLGERINDFMEFAKTNISQQDAAPNSRTASLRG